MNTIKIRRDLNGVRVEASARYAESEDGWYCSVGVREDGKLRIVERTGPVNDAFTELSAMVIAHQYGTR